MKHKAIIAAAVVSTIAGTYAAASMLPDFMPKKTWYEVELRCEALEQVMQATMPVAKGPDSFVKMLAGVHSPQDVVKITDNMEAKLIEKGLLKYPIHMAKDMTKAIYPNSNGEIFALVLGPPPVTHTFINDYDKCMTARQVRFSK